MISTFEDLLKKKTESPRTDTKFGIIDNEPAQTTIQDLDSCEAIVLNEQGESVSFTPIDKVLIIHKTGSAVKEESLCDGLLTTNKNFYLVELKSRKEHSVAKEEAIRQLKNTIRLMREEDSSFSLELKKGKKKAFLCNKKHPHFRTIESSEQKSFYSETGFRLDVNRKIKIK